MEIGEELKAFLQAQAFAAVCLAVDAGEGKEAVVLVKSSRDLTSGLREAEAAPELGWVVEQTRRGPVVCLVLRAEGAAVGDLSAEIYFDAADPADGDLLDHLARQPRVRVVFVDEEIEPVWMAELPWDEIRRLEAEQVRDRAAELLERSPVYDFEQAKELFQTRTSHGRLLARAFPEDPAPA
ncbi:MAG: hypothetical protein Kow0092_19930 [Deferrisomatales bacterium]